MKEVKQYYWLDFFKYVFAVLIICLHVPHEGNRILTFISMYISRLGVPFFFTVSGFFGYKKLRKEGATGFYRERFNKLIRLLAKWTVIYLPLTFYYQWIASERNLVQTFIECIRQEFVLAPAYMWYLVALLIALFPFSRMTGKRNKHILYAASALIFYVMGVLLNSWRTICGADSLTIYYEVFETSRNGIFFAPLFLAMGSGIAMLEENNKLHINCLQWIMALVSYVIFTIEVTFIHNRVPNTEDCSMYFTLPFVIWFMCCIICGGGQNRKNTLLRKWSLRLRSMSEFVYCSQFGFLYIFTKIFNVCGWKNYGVYLLICTAITASFYWMIKNTIVRKRNV